MRSLTTTKKFWDAYERYKDTSDYLYRYYDELSKLLDFSDDTKQLFAHIFFDLAFSIQYATLDYTTAIEYYQRAIQLGQAISTPNLNELGTVQMCLGEAFRDSGQLEQAIAQYDHATQKFQRTNNTDAEFNVRGFRAVAKCKYGGRQNLQAIEAELLQCLQHFEQIENKDKQKWTLMHLANVCQQLQTPDTLSTAVKYYRAALKLSDSIYNDSSHEHHIWPLLQLSRVLIKTSRYEEAEPCITRGLKIAELKLPALHLDRCKLYFEYALLLELTYHEVDAIDFYIKAARIQLHHQAISVFINYMSRVSKLHSKLNNVEVANSIQEKIINCTSTLTVSAFDDLIADLLTSKQNQFKLT